MRPESDQDGLGQSLREQGAWLRRLVWGLGERHDDIDDLTQDVFVAALRDAPRGRGPALRAWLRAAAQRLAAHAGRSERQRAHRERRVARPEAHEPSADDDAEARLEAQRRLLAAVEELDAHHRTAIVLRYMDGLSPGEVATRLDISPDTARQRISRALAKLRARLAPELRERKDLLAAFVCLAHPPALRVATATSLPQLSAKLALWTVLVKKPLALLSLAALLGVGWVVIRPLDGAEPRTDAEMALNVVPSDNYPPVQESTADGAAGRARTDAPDAAPAVIEERAPETPIAAIPELVFHGRVIDRETRAPIPNARVGRSEDWAKILDSAEQRTDVEGRFRVSGSSSSRSLLSVLAPGYEVAALGLLSGHEDAENPFEIELSVVASARVTVLDAAGTPIPNATVTFFTAAHRFGRPNGNAVLDSGRFNDVHFRATTGTNGVAVITDLPARLPLEGVVHRQREKLLKAPEKLFLEPGELRELVWRLGAGARLEGVALELDGQRAPGVLIGFEVARMPINVYFEPIGAKRLTVTTTDAAGRFEFADVPPGICWVGPVPGKLALEKVVNPADIAPYGQLVEVRAGAEPALLTVMLHRGLAIHGQVLTPNGEPAKSASIHISRATPALYAVESTNDAEGRFALGPLQAGDYELQAMTTGRFVPSEAVRARAGDMDVVLQLREGGGVRGVIVDSSSGTPCAAELVANHRERAIGGASFARSDPRGQFDVKGLAPGTYDVAARTLDGRIGFATAIRVASGPPGEDVRIEVAPGAWVRVHFVGPWASAAVSVLVGDVPVDVDGIEQGTERTVAGPAGKVVVRIRHHAENQDFDLPLELQAGETRDVTFDGAWK